MRGRLRRSRETDVSDRGSVTTHAWRAGYHQDRSTAHTHTLIQADATVVAVRLLLCGAHFHRLVGATTHPCARDSFWNRKTTATISKHLVWREKGNKVICQEFDKSLGCRCVLNRLKCSWSKAELQGSRHTEARTSLGCCRENLWNCERRHLAVL